MILFMFTLLFCFSLFAFVLVVGVGLEPTSIRGFGLRRVFWCGVFAVLAFAIVAVAAAALHRRVGALRWVFAGLLALTGVLTLVYAVLTGDAGARAKWG